MSRVPMTTSMATLVLLLAGAAWPAGAQPIPPEGPAVNPSIYKVPAGAKTINIDCDAQQTLASALADKSTADLNIVFSGTCKEYVYLQRDGVAIVAEGGAPRSDRLGEDPYDTSAKRGGLVGADGARAARRVDAGAPAGLVRVDVPDPDDDALVHEHLLHRLLRPPKNSR